MPYRLGDDVDDYCIKCKRLTNHSIVSLLNEDPAKVRCRTCYNDHDFRHCEVPPTKKELKKAALLQEVLAAGGTPPVEGEDGVAVEGEAAAVPVDGEVAVEAPKAKKGARKGRSA